MEPDFKEGDQVLVSTLSFNNLKGPNKMKDSFLGPFTIIKLIGKMQWRRGYIPLQEQDIVEVKESPGPVRKIIRAKKIRLNGKDHRQYLVRVKYQTADKDKCLAEVAIPDGNLHLRRFRASRRAEKSNQL
ncbi:hypothetical protein O181_038317 [Austropuccinia psidii MF-1]|uniref:Uncharacterized protein n=1 Tax=Austropuccinia psidii MF-1 TaxID=1389203 RepID=A0A9Q3DEI5_9BASI|nr:hypothetical protein [Austropuccinia psidii MF-1]